MAFWRNEIVLLIAHATEITPMAKLVVADKVCKTSCCLPLVNQIRDEIDTWLDRENKTRLQLAAQAKRGKAEARILLRTTRIAYMHLAIILHIMYIEAHHVA